MGFYFDTIRLAISSEFTKQAVGTRFHHRFGKLRPTRRLSHCTHSPLRLGARAAALPNEVLAGGEPSLSRAPAASRAGKG